MAMLPALQPPKLPAAAELERLKRLKREEAKSLSALQLGSRPQTHSLSRPPHQPPAEAKLEAQLLSMAAARATRPGGRLVAPSRRSQFSAPTLAQVLIQEDALRSRMRVTFTPANLAQQKAQAQDAAQANLFRLGSYDSRAVSKDNAERERRREAFQRRRQLAPSFSEGMLRSRQLAPSTSESLRRKPVQHPLLRAVTQEGPLNRCVAAGSSPLVARPHRSESPLPLATKESGFVRDPEARRLPPLPPAASSPPPRHSQAAPPARSAEHMQRAAALGPAPAPAKAPAPARPAAVRQASSLGRGLPAEDVTAWQAQPACGDPCAVIGQVEEEDPLMPRDFDGWGSP